MTTYVPQCLFCKHYRKGDEGSVCSAFPDGIPSPILRNDHDHRKPYDGDHGIRFEPIDEDAAETVAEMFEGDV